VFELERERGDEDGEEDRVRGSGFWGKKRYAKRESEGEGEML